MFELAQHGPDTYVGTGPRYPWGGLYGGQIVAQALRAAADTVDREYEPHSIRAYFIRPGDHTEPIRYEVDRIRNGRSFVTRRVVARQAVGAILNAECSFQKPEESLSIQTIAMPDVPEMDGIENSSFSPHFERRFVEPSPGNEVERDGDGRVIAWMKVAHQLPPDDHASNRNLHECWLAYLSDDLASDTVHAAYARYRGDDVTSHAGISLDHTIWFHRPLRADEWHLHDFSCHHFTGHRGLALGHVFSGAGEHVASVAQEVLLRPERPPR